MRLDNDLSCWVGQFLELKTLTALQQRLMFFLGVDQIHANGSYFGWVSLHFVLNGAPCTIVIRCTCEDNSGALLTSDDIHDGAKVEKIKLWANVHLGSCKMVDFSEESDLTFAGLESLAEYANREILSDTLVSRVYGFLHDSAETWR